jgi:hypothetical protein
LITASPPRLERLAIQATPASAGAMDCQTKTARAILCHGTGYLLAVTENRPSLHAGAERVSGDPATGLTLRQHLLALLRLTLTKQGFHDTRRLMSVQPCLLYWPSRHRADVAAAWHGEGHCLHHP